MKLVFRVLAGAAHESVEEVLDDAAQEALWGPDSLLGRGREE